MVYFLLDKCSVEDLSFIQAEVVLPQTVPNLSLMTERDIPKSRNDFDYMSEVKAVMTAAMTKLSEGEKHRPWRERVRMYFQKGKRT